MNRSTPALDQSLRNLRFVISFRGDGLQGYQRQPHAETVEGCLLQAWKILTGEDTKLISCSRLDTGVHADHFVFNLHSHDLRSEEELIRGLNGILHHVLQKRICIFDCSPVDQKFHARFDAVGKHYRYLIWYGRARHAHFSDRVWHVRKREINFDLQTCVKLYEGTHDFSAFRSQDCQAASPVKNIARAEFWIHPDFRELGVVDFWGQGFLKNMIRNLVGSAVEVAAGNLTHEQIALAFKHGDRRLTGPCAPGHALCLKKVFYSTQEFQRAVESGSSSNQIL